MNLSLNKTNFVLQSFIYDFSKHGGAVGTYFSGIQINNLAVIFFSINIITDLASAGNSNIRLGTSLNDQLIVDSNFNSFNPPGIYTGAGNNPSVMDNSLNINFYIQTDPLIAGKLIFYTYSTS